MKMPAVILTTSLVLFTACSYSHFGDADIRQNLPGTWHSTTTEDASKSTIKIATDGSFTSQTFSPSGTLSVELSGAFQVGDGNMNMTVTKSSHTNEQVPFTIPGKLAKADSREMVIWVVGVGGVIHKVTMQKDIE